MLEKPRVVITHSRRHEPAAKKFLFTHEDISPNGLQEFRHRAWESFSQLSTPTIAEETWRRTDLQTLPADAFRLPTKDQYLKLASVPKNLINSLTSKDEGGLVILQPGAGGSKNPQSLSEKGVIFTDLLSANPSHLELVKQIAGKIIKPEEDIFTALSAAFSHNGILLYIPKGVSIDHPLHSIAWGPGSNLAHLAHNIIWLEDGASATLLYETSSPDINGSSLHCGNLEIRVGEGASLTLIELQTLGKNTWNFTRTHAQVEKNGRVDWIHGAVGSKLSKVFSNLDLIGEGASGRMSGFYFVNGEQHLDLDTQQNHLAPHTSSDLLYKGALLGASRAIWQGMIYVAPEAQKTDGYQANRNLVLSNQARADSIPGLEILADDVRCTHGATIGKIEAEPLFYLMSRGMPLSMAQVMMVEGFFDPIMQRIPVNPVRKRFQQMISRKMIGAA